MENNPYAPPASSMQGAPELVRVTEASDFRDLSGISGKLSILLLLAVALAMLGIVASLMQLNLLSHSYTRAELTADVTRVQLISAGRVVLRLITTVVFGRWIYLAQRNLPELDARLLRFTPGWAVGSFFIPLLNLWAPCQAMNQLVKASRNPRQWELEDTPVLIVIWWALWLIAQVLGNVVFRVAFGVKTPSQLYGATELDIALSAVLVPLYLVAWAIVRRVWRDQAETYAQMKGAPAQ